MPSEQAKKLLEKVSASQYALLRDLTEKESLDARWLEEAITSLVKDRFSLARGFLRAARALVRSSDPIVRRSAVSRAYYAAYHAARATVLQIGRRDEDKHEALWRDIDKLVPGTGETLKELRQRRNESDYSPYPASNAQAPYEEKAFNAIIRDSIRRSDDFVRRLAKHLRERR